MTCRGKDRRKFLMPYGRRACRPKLQDHAPASASTTFHVGQQATTRLSGGEAQTVSSLAKALGKPATAARSTSWTSRPRACALPRFCGKKPARVLHEPPWWRRAKNNVVVTSTISNVIKTPTLVIRPRPRSVFRRRPPRRRNRRLGHAGGHSQGAMELYGKFWVAACRRSTGRS